MSSQVEICNLALSRVGVSSFIEDIQEGSKESKSLGAVYGIARDVALGSFPWPFAQRRTTLALSAEPAREDWAYTYALPTDALRVQGLWSGIRFGPVASELPFAIEMNASGTGRLLLSDMESATVVYTARVEDPLLYPPLFVNAFAWLLAAEVALPLSVRPDLRAQAQQQFELTLSRAQAGALNEARETWPESELITVRL